jgi:hypothetical protein
VSWEKGTAGLLHTFRRPLAARVAPIRTHGEHIVEHWSCIRAEAFRRALVVRAGPSLNLNETFKSQEALTIQLFVNGFTGYHLL